MKNSGILIGLLLTVSPAFGQSPRAPLAFEVATVKPSAPLDPAALRAGKAHTGTRIDDARVDIGTASLFRLICIAYRVRPYRVAGPDWMKTAMFDVVAKIPDGGKADQAPEMLQTLLMERFGLKIHVDSRDEPVYALVVGRGGPKMTESAPEPVSSAAAASGTNPDGKTIADSMSVPTVQGDVKMTRTAEGLSLEMPGGEIAGKVRVSMGRGSGSMPPRFHLESSGTSMKIFAEMLSVGVVDRPVVDMTGLTGNYEVAVDLSAEDAMNVTRASVAFTMGGGGGGDNRPPRPGDAASDPPGASIFSSIQNLGLRLEPRKLPLDMLVVDHMEKTPTAN